MFKKALKIGFSLVLVFSSVFQTYAAADLAANSDAWVRNNVDNADIGTTGTAVNTSFALAADNDKVEVSVMVRNTGDAVSGAIELWRTGDPDGSYVNNTLRKYQSGSWTDLNANWTDFNTSGTKLNLGTLVAGSGITVVYQIDVGGSHAYGDILKDYIRIYEATTLVKDISVSTYVPYLEIQSANSGDNSIILNSAVDLLESAAETIGNFEVSSNNGGSFTTLSGPSTATYLNTGTGRTITLSQSQVDFNSGDDIVVRLSGLKTADDLRFLSPTDFTINASKVTTDPVAAVDTVSPTFTAGLDTIAGTNGVLFLTFDEPMNVATLNSANVLARTFFDNGHDLGTSPTVVWTSTSTVKITLDTDGDVVVGDNVTLDSNITDLNGNAVDGAAVLISAIVLDAPTIDTFTIADQSSASTLYTNDRTIDVTSFTASDNNGIVTGYLVNENATTPALSAINNNPAPTTYTITGAEGSRTIYAWVKDDDDHITGGTSADITLDLTDPVVNADLATGTYNSTQTVTLSFDTETNPDKIYYTLDGSTPDNTDTQYTVPLSINSDVTLKLIGYDLAENVSSVVTRTYTFVCNPNSVSNGSVSAYPACTITCNSGYSLSGNACVLSSSSSSGGGGGGGGGGSSVNTTTIYDLPTLPSQQTIRVHRPIRVSGSTFTRPVRQTNYYTEAQAEIPFGTEVFDLENKSLTGAVIYPIQRVKADEAKTDLRIPKPSKTLVYSSYYQFGSLNEQFSEEIKISIPVASSVAKQEKAKFNIYKWVPGAGTSTVSSNGTVYRAGEWVRMGDGTLLDADGVLKFSTTHSTLIAFTSTITSDPDDDKIIDEDNLTSFRDILGHWAKTYIEKLYLKGIVSGKTETSFAPNKNLTRAELTKIALNSFEFDLPENVTQKPFSDVALDAWYVAFVAKGKDEGIIGGYADGTFRPNQPVNRAEALKILIEAAGIDTADYEAQFLDTEQTAWYSPYIAYAKQKGIVEGYAIQVAKPTILSGSKVVAVADVYNFSRYLGEGDFGEDVRHLKEILTLLGYYKGDLSLSFTDDLKKALIQFQLEKGIIVSETSLGAGYLRTLTLAKLLQENVQNKVEFDLKTQYYFKPEQFITRAEIAKIAMKLIEE